MVVGGKNSFTHRTMAGGTFNLKEMYQMSNQRPHSRRLRELLNQIRQNSMDDMPDFEYDSNDLGHVSFNSHVLFQEVCAKITAEQDIKLVREIALDYLNAICAVTPDRAATDILLRMDGIK